MKKIKWLIISLLIILVILIGAIIIIINLNPNNIEDEIGDEGLVIDYDAQEVEQVTSNINFYTVSNCINQYLDIINLDSSIYYGYDDNNNYTKIIDDNEIKENIYYLLDSTYTSENGITLDNLYDNINTLNEKIIFMPIKMNVLTKANVEVYAVYGIEYTLENEYVGDAYFIVNLDRNNNTFSIQPIKNGEYTNIDDIELINNDDKTIDNNNFNEFVEARITYEELLQNYISSYKTIAIVKPDLMYELLDEEYKNKKFGSLENFEIYISNNKEEIQRISLQSYQVNNYDDYTQYVCVDQNGKYYIFNETAVMDYTLILDTYTIDLPQFTEEYNNSTDSEKVLLNIQKIFAAINDGDYSYVYGKLDTTFKQNNFPTEADFEAYIKANFYENNSIAYSNYQTSGNLHIFEISITNADDETSSAVTKNFIMQLLDGTDFVMSFNV